MTQAQRALVASLLICSGIALFYFLMINTAPLYRTDKPPKTKPTNPKEPTKPQKPHDEAKSLSKIDKELPLCKPAPPAVAPATPPAVTTPGAPPVKITFDQKFERLLKYMKERGINLVVDGLIFELQGGMRGVSYVWHGLVPELHHMLREPPNKLTVIQRGARDLRTSFNWWDINVVPGDGVGITQQVNSQRKTAYISSYYSHVPGVCNMLMSYDCLPVRVTQCFLQLGKCWHSHGSR